MAQTAQILGDSTKYQVHPQVKLYTLTDLNFQESRQHNYTLLRPLSGNSPYATSYQLKLKIMQDLKNLRLDVVDASGLHTLNIFKLPQAEAIIEQYHYVMQELVTREVLQVLE
ncbi:cysteine desulfurase [Lactobacillus sp. DCY120]|uniref:Cysteine desulfurase n=1 Tax=Bombilactobacillus apium TaxID=2675299 RepID=A0A850QV88_9LACO|nr:cysteine desulfurase [Bombilactobacillus apium]NVY95694.1 cysteine desulfurase [Bombilactobacillus apium]